MRKKKKETYGVLALLRRGKKKEVRPSIKKKKGGECSTMS